MGKKIGDFFFEDEVLREVNDQWSKSELLAQEGLFRYSKVADVLEIDKQKFRKYIARQDDDYMRDRFGITKVGQLRVRMRVFRKMVNWVLKEFPRRGRVREVYVDPGRPTEFEEFPKDIDRDGFFELDGVYKLKEVMDTGYLPYTERNVIMMITAGEERLDPDICGIWKTPKFYLVDFKKFLAWVFSRLRNVSLEEARQTLFKK